MRFYMHSKLMVYYNSYLASLMKLLENSPKIAEIESRLAKYTFLSRSNLPGYLDGLIFESLNDSQNYPDRRCNPNFYHWYILMRQFAASTISKWINDRLYFDGDDVLMQNFHKTCSPSKGYVREVGSPAREQNLDELKSPKLELIQVQYVIDVLLKDYSEQLVDQLRRCLEAYRLDITASKATRQIKIKCGSASNRQEIANLISKTIEYENLQVKRYKKNKASIREDPLRE